MINFVKKRNQFFFILFTQNKEKKSRPNLFLFLFSLSHFFSLLFEPQKKTSFSSLLFFFSLSLCVTQKNKEMDEEEHYPNKETEELFEGVENGDEEVVKVLLLGNKNKQFELDINFQSKRKKVFFFQT